ncbi:lysozyme inhibitor LprI family protein [Pseudomonas sp. LB-090624]|uniref:lysozyme inhibitor LprI family protein n=1 Tax=Pseudomonas sp. LB-090624 TaxID=2213079 RepID=UPI001304E201|nr:lysozyme inhibitor LprI family protein [Pseudomonas sp. LB-090624]
MKGSIAVGITALALTGNIAHADRGREEAQQMALHHFQATLENRYQHCMKAAKTTWDSDHCLALKRDSVNDAVEWMYQVKLAQAQIDLKYKRPAESDKVPEMLQQSQALWKQYTDAECQGLFEQYISGTIRTGISIDCQYRLAVQRLAVLQQW